MNLETLKLDFQKITDRVELPDYLNLILNKITNSNISIHEVEKTLVEFNIHTNIAKLDFLNLIFEYIKVSFHDNILTKDEKWVITYLKKLFQIVPGDFVFHCKEKVDLVIQSQLSLIYSDNYVTPEEALMKTELQELFDLGFDQMNEYSKNESITSLRQGARLEDLDVLFTHAEFFDLKLV